MRALMATVLTVAMIASVPAAAQKVSRDYETDDLKQWDVVHCGGTGGNCPCTNISGGGAGSCSTATNTSTPPAGNRLVLDPANAIQGNYSLKVTVCDGDYWPNNSSSNT